MIQELKTGVTSQQLEEQVKELDKSIAQLEEAKQMLQGHIDELKKDGR